MNFQALIDVLPIIAQGWLGTFLVTLIIIAAVLLLGKLGGKD